VRIAEPVATSETNQDPSKLADDMIEGVSAGSVAISARPAMADITSRAISSPYDVVHGSEHSDPTSHWRAFTQEPNATGPLLAAYDGIRQLVKLADRHKKKLRIARHEARTAQADLKCAQNEMNSFARVLEKSPTELRDRDEVETPWCLLTEREPSPSGPLLAAYDAVDALRHRVEFHREMHAGADPGMEELHVYTLSCEDRINELQDEIEEVLDSKTGKSSKTRKETGTSSTPVTRSSPR